MICIRIVDLYKKNTKGEVIACDKIFLFLIILIGLVHRFYYNKTSKTY